MTLAGEVASAATEESVDAATRVTAIAALMGIRDVEVLAAELDADPIGGVSNPADEEADEAIETAGAVAPVELMTMFQSKGLSAQHVMIIGCDDSNLKRTAPLTFFVALTRARRSLHLITSMKAGGATSVHPYQLDIPEECCDFGAYKKSSHSVDPLDGMRGFKQQLARWRSTATMYTKKAAAKKAAPRRSGGR